MNCNASGVEYLLIEKIPERAYFCKALGVTPRTLEIFDALEIADQAIDAGVWITGMTTFDNGVETDSQNPSSEGLPYVFLAAAYFWRATPPTSTLPLAGKA